VGAGLEHNWHGFGPNLSGLVNPQVAHLTLAATALTRVWIWDRSDCSCRAAPPAVEGAVSGSRRTS
jgi:hypothetical protein